MVVILSKQQSDGWWRTVTSKGVVIEVDDCPLTKQYEGKQMKTINDVIRLSTERFTDKKCLGTRRLLVRHVDTSQSKPLEKLEFGQYEWITYNELYESSLAVGHALKDLGYGAGERVAMFAETRAEWLMAAFGIIQQKMVVCTLYATLSNSAVIHALNETEAPLLFTTYDLMPRLLSVLPQCSFIKTLIVMEDQLEGVGNYSAEIPNLPVISFKNLVKRGQKFLNEPVPVVNEDETAIIMYTSGSTGTPKGVEISHKNIVTFVFGYTMRIPVCPNDRYLAFLPLAHIMELVSEMALIASGIQVFYSSPSTFTSASPKIFPGTEGDAKVAKPTLMNCVPLVLDKVIKSVTQKVEQQGWLKSFVFKKLVTYKWFFEYIPFTTSILDFLVFQKVKVELGGHLMTIVTGGAPLSTQTQEQFKSLFGCNLIVGYGSTETAACVTCMLAGDSRFGHTGMPNSGVGVKLIDWEEGDYRVSDKPNPRGEIVVCGPCVAKGYFKRPEETVASFVEENGVRCFHTGDIGEIDEYGCLKIIDRKKDLVKMKHGEYISLGSIESILKTVPVVDNVCIFADPLKDRVVAVVVPVREILLSLALQEPTTAVTNPDLNNMTHLYANKKLNKMVLDQIQSYARQCQLNKWETPVAVHLTSEVWLPETNLVTAALKLRRKQLAERYGAAVQSMYNAIE